MKTEAEIKEAIQLLKSGAALGTLLADPEMNRTIRLAAAMTLAGLKWTIGEPSPADELLAGLKRDFNAFHGKVTPDP